MHALAQGCATNGKNKDSSLLDTINAIKTSAQAVGLKIPVMPEPLLRISYELRSNSVDMDVVSDIIKLDGGLSTIILKAANSAAYGGKVTINDAKQASVLLGPNVVRSLISSMMWAEINRRVSRDMPAIVSYLWRFNAQMSRFVRLLLSEYSDLGNSFLLQHPSYIEECEIAALFANSGLFLAAFHQPQEAAEVIKQSNNQFGRFCFMLPNTSDIYEEIDQSVVLSQLFASEWGASREICNAVLMQRFNIEADGLDKSYVRFMHSLIVIARFAINIHYRETFFSEYVLHEENRDIQIALNEVGFTEDDICKFFTGKMDTILSIDDIDNREKKSGESDSEEGLYRFTLQDGREQLERVSPGKSVYYWMRILNAIAAQPEQ